MKQIAKTIHFSLLSLIISMIGLVAKAQDKGLDIDINVDKKQWYEQPWAWVVGAAIFILLLVAILRGGKKS